MVLGLPIPISNSYGMQRESYSEKGKTIWGCVIYSDTSTNVAERSMPGTQGLLRPLGVFMTHGSCKWFATTFLWKKIKQLRGLTFQK